MRASQPRPFRPLVISLILGLGIGAIINLYQRGILRPLAQAPVCGTPDRTEQQCLKCCEQKVPNKDANPVELANCIEQCSPDENQTMGD